MTIKEAQEWLCLHNIFVKVDGQDGPATQAAIRQFQRKNGLPETGIASGDTAAFLCQPLTSATNLGGFRAASPGEAVVTVAQHYLSFHPREVGGQNRGPWVRHFMRGNEGDAWPWCCGTVCTILKQASTLAGEMKIKYTASCDVLAQQAMKLGAFVVGEKREDLAPGALFLIRGKVPGDWTHTGIVTNFNVDHYFTIEGNSNDEGSREGHELCARIRAYRNVDFIRV